MLIESLFAPFVPPWSMKAHIFLWYVHFLPWRCPRATLLENSSLDLGAQRKIANLAWTARQHDSRY